MEEFEDRAPLSTAQETDVCELRREWVPPARTMWNAIAVTAAGGELDSEGGDAFISGG